MKLLVFLSIFSLTFIQSYAQETVCTLIEDSNYFLFQKSDDYTLFFHTVEGINTEEITNFKNEIQTFVENELSDITGNPKRRIKKIYRKTQERYFDQYQQFTNLKEHIENGIFNEITSAMLFTLIFEKLQIPYQIKQEPENTFLVAFPDTEMIPIEAFPAQHRTVYSIDSKAIEENINQLVEQKLLSRQEVQNKGVLQAYKDFYFKEENIRKSRLAGHAFYHQGIELIEQEDLENSLQFFAKAECLIPHNLYNIAIRSVLMQKAANLDRRSSEYIKSNIDYIAIFGTENNHYWHNTTVSFTNLASNDKFSELHNIINYSGTQGIEKEQIKELEEILYLHHLRYFTEHKKLDSVIDYSQRFYELDTVKNVHKAKFYANSAMLNFYGKKYSRGSTIEDLKKLRNTYSLFGKIPEFLGLLTHCYTYQIVEHHKINKKKKVLNFFSEYKKAVKKQQAEDRVNEQIGGVYKIISSIYYQKRMFKKSISILEEGVLLAPENIELKDMLKEMKRHY